MLQSRHTVTASIFQRQNMQKLLSIDRDTDKTLREKEEESKMSLLWAEGNICIALAYFLTNSHPSVCDPFVLPQTFRAYAQYSRCTRPYGQVGLLPWQCSQQAAALVSFMQMSEELRCESSEPHRWRRRNQFNLCDTLPAQSHHSQQIETWVQCSGSASDSQSATVLLLYVETEACLQTVCPTLWFSSILVFAAQNEYTHLNPLTRTDMFLRLQPCDTRPGSWLCCPVQKRNRREHSADMVSSDREYSAGDVDRLADVSLFATQKWTQGEEYPLTFIDE